MLRTACVEASHFTLQLLLRRETGWSKQAELERLLAEVKIKKEK